MYILQHTATHCSCSVLQCVAVQNHMNTICTGLRCLVIFHPFIPPPVRHASKLLSALFSCSAPTRLYLIPPLLFLSLVLFCCLTLDCSTICAPQWLLCHSCSQRLPPRHSNLILIAFITGNSSLEPLIEGLCAQIHVNLR